MAEFFDIVKYRKISLWSSKDIVECCFIVQNSLSYLNLELCNSCVSHEFGHRTLSYHSGEQFYDGFLNTEEKCRKKFDRNRYLMYRLHLDIPKERSVSLRHGPGPHELISGLLQFPIGMISVSKDFYPYVLSRFIECVFGYTCCCAQIELKVRVTKWLLRLDAAKEFELSRLSAEVTNYFVDLLYPKFIGSELMKQFLLRCNLGGWIETYEKPEVLEDLLYHAHRSGRRTLVRDDTHDNELTSMCIFQQAFVNVDPLLKFRYSPSFCSSNYNLFISVILHYGKYMNLTKEVLLKPESWMRKERYFLLLQIVLIFFTQSSDPPNAEEALRVLWSTYSDSYITLEEIKKAFGDVLDPEVINEMYGFYAQSVREAVDVVEPRSLKQLCRFKIRKVLWLNQHWLPEGIARTGLPDQLQAFLNLQKVGKYRVAIVKGKSTLLQNEDMNNFVG